MAQVLTQACHCKLPHTQLHMQIAYMYNRFRVQTLNPTMQSADLIEAVHPSLSEESPDIGVPQQVILGSPTHNLHIPAHLQSEVAQTHNLQVLLGQLPNDFDGSQC